MYVVRFKRTEMPCLFLTHGDQKCQWGLSPNVDLGRRFATPQQALTEIEAIKHIVIPKKVFDFDERILFLMRLYGDTWDDCVEGLLVEMTDKVKAQICTPDLFVAQTHVMENQTWNFHY